MKGVHEIIKTKLTALTADVDVHRGFDDQLGPYMIAAVGQNAEEV